SAVENPFCALRQGERVAATRRPAPPGPCCCGPRRRRPLAPGGRATARSCAGYPRCGGESHVKPIVVGEGSGRAYSPAPPELGDRSTPVFTGAIRHAGDAAEALLAAVGGRGIVVHALAERDVIDRLVDDLRRLGPVDHRTGEPAPGPGLTADERKLLDALASRKTLGGAPAELHPSRRSADRPLAAARHKLGAAPTAQAGRAP